MMDLFVGLHSRAIETDLSEPRLCPALGAPLGLEKDAQLVRRSGPGPPTPPRAWIHSPEPWTRLYGCVSPECLGRVGCDVGVRVGPCELLRL